MLITEESERDEHQPCDVVQGVKSNDFSCRSPSFERSLSEIKVAPRRESCEKIILELYSF